MSNPNVNLEGRSIAELRKMAKEIGITGSRDWGADDFRRAIYSRRSTKAVARVVEDTSKPIPPGYARIQIMATEGDDVPIAIKINKFEAMIPRDTIVDVPCEVVDTCIKNALVENPRKRKGANGQDETYSQYVLAYPYTEFGRDDSICVIAGTRTAQAQGIREKYKAIFGKYPKRKQQGQFEEHLAKLKFAQLSGDAPMDDETKAVLGLK